MRKLNIIKNASSRVVGGAFFEHWEEWYGITNERVSPYVKLT